MDQQQQPVAQSTFPPPPAYYALFRDDPADGAQPLAPPEPPTQGEYRVFDFKTELRSLTVKLVATFLELLQTLVSLPAESARRLEAVGLCFRNLHYLLALLRPVQARMTMAHMLRTRIQQQTAALEQLRQQQDALSQVLQGAAQQLGAVEWRDAMVEH